MALPKNIVEKIALIVIKTLVGRFASFPANTESMRNAPFHEAFLKAFSDHLAGKQIDSAVLITFGSWLHGLNTTLGMVFFEKTAHILSYGDKRELKGGLISENQFSSINEIITKLKNSESHPCLASEDEMISDPRGNHTSNAPNFTADVFIQDSDNIVAIEIKSVKPNSGEMRSEKHKILLGKAVLKNMYPSMSIKYFIGFPFDPTVKRPEEDECSSYKQRFLTNIVDGHKYFDFEEILLAEEMWDFLSGDTNTMKQILGIINTISTIEFMNIYEKIKYPEIVSRDTD